MAAFKTLDELEVAGRRVLVRADLNVPMDADHRVADASRIEAVMPTLAELARRRARTLILSHFGRPKGKVVPDMSLRPLARPLSDALGGAEVAFAEDCIGGAAEAVAATVPAGGFALLENLRFHAGEEANDPAFADALAELGQVYVNDAFSASHRAHASVVGLPARLPHGAGRLMQAELEALDRALGAPERPAMAIVGGAKVSTKLAVLGHLIDKMDFLAIGGGMANTFLHAQGVPVGRSLCEHDLAAEARAILDKAEGAGCTVILPSDAVVAPGLDAGGQAQTVAISAVPEDRMILDVGPGTAATINRHMAGCRTLVWNGPLGAFETPPFDAQTTAVARTAARLTAAGGLISVAGGGDTLAALARAGVADGFTHVSTAGGAFLEWMEGRPLPGIEALHA